MTAPRKYEFKIESGIPYVEWVRPQKRVRKNKNQRYYPFHQLQPGDSFFVAKSKASFTQVRVAAYYFMRGHPNFKIKVRRVSNPDGCRAWRLG